MGIQFNNGEHHSNTYCYVRPPMLMESKTITSSHPLRLFFDLWNTGARSCLSCEGLWCVINYIPAWTNEAFMPGMPKRPYQQQLGEGRGPESSFCEVPGVYLSAASRKKELTIPQLYVPPRLIELPTCVDSSHKFTNTINLTCWMQCADVWIHEKYFRPTLDMENRPPWNAIILVLFVSTRVVYYMSK